MKKFLLTVMTTIAVGVSANPSPTTERLLIQLEKNIKGTMLAIAESEELAGKSVDDLHHVIEFPETSTADLGLLLNFDEFNKNKKVSILAVTPGSSAEDEGIKPGDELIAVNELMIKDSMAEQIIDSISNVVPGERISMQVNSNGEIKDIDMTVKGRMTPGVRLEIGSASNNNIAKVDNEPSSSECGSVSTFFTPPQSNDIFLARVDQINGENVPRFRHTTRVPVGKQTISVHEYISDPWIKRKVGIQRAKDLEITIEPNKIYYIGAKFIRENRLKRKGELYWEPVVWKEKALNCEL